MNFNLENAGSGTREISPNWHEGVPVFEVGDKNFIFSNDLNEALRITDNSICTIFFAEDTAFLANITDVEDLDKVSASNRLLVSLVKQPKEFKKARTARRGELLKLWKTKMSGNLYTIDPEWVNRDSNYFPLVKLKPYITSPMVQEHNEIVTSNHEENQLHWSSNTEQNTTL